jgi:8-oxo-dGTP pyrophosphatase MutT (NUDIX family)
MSENGGQKLQVVAAIIERDGRFLLGKRSPHKPSAPHYWCPICGGIEAGELQAQAVVREVHEETGLAVSALEKVAECETHDGTAVIHWWRAVPLDAAPARLANDEHSELRWVTLAELRALEPIFPEDVAIFERASSQSCAPAQLGEPPAQADEQEAPVVHELRTLPFIGVTDELENPADDE